MKELGLALQQGFPFLLFISTERDRKEASLVPGCSRPSERTSGVLNKISCHRHRSA